MTCRFLDIQPAIQQFCLKFGEKNKAKNATHTSDDRSNLSRVDFAPLTTLQPCADLKHVIFNRRNK